ncbi:odorant receptor 46a-like [Halyomorpha halys]|uniref:odorant receptor 46a-like n=1 Tax=Halyomorpha halys TaxID=286706 RepID=UPI0034D2A38C
MSLQFETTHSSMIHLLRRSGLKLPWVKHRSYWNQFCYFAYDILLFTIGLYQFICSACSIIFVPTFQDMCTLGIVTSVLATGGSITLFYFFYQNRLEKFTDNWNALNDNILNSDLDKKDFFRQMFLQVAKNNESFTKTILFVVFWTPIIYCTPVPVVDAIKQSYRTNLPLPILYLYDDRQPVVYEVTFFLHMMGLVISVMKKFGNDCFFLALFKIHIAYLRYLSVAIKCEGTKFSKCNNKIIKQNLISWIKIHQQIVKNAQDLIRLYTPIIIVYHVNLICIVVFGLFTQIKNDRDSSVQRIGTAMFCTVNIFQLYMQCSSAEELTNEAEKVSQEIYNTPWNEVDECNADIIRLVLKMASRPVEVTAFKAPTFLLNKQSFVAV